ncbi:hypothetical protein AUK40_03655 [Candidatus Wirthbacteria bacterium CG2_30_54_11]|uniref:Uncharacterized protein n=1 Tax=Candidatus Wirthbacteria bacterium CG2_30_54_11 TaxID=1817892 RepID=A0A1J5IJH8_9BACT|nr:MAG: hypothetical protein AUK40_03655 [Candidatus Wirthbacteria bacterium CG2_30_54_11]
MDGRIPESSGAFDLPQVHDQDDFTALCPMEMFMYEGKTYCKTNKRFFIEVVMWEDGKREFVGSGLEVTSIHHAVDMIQTPGIVGFLKRFAAQLGIA